MEEVRRDETTQVDARRASATSTMLSGVFGTLSLLTTGITVLPHLLSL